MSKVSARIDPEVSLLGDVAILQRKWQAALAPGQRLPPYEEVMLGSLGRLADHVLLLSGNADGAYTVVRAGRWIEDWIGSESHGKPIAQLPSDCATALGESVSRALHDGLPTLSIAHRVRNGIVESYRLLTLPLSSRWGAQFIAVYVRECGSRYSLVETIFRSTEHGILALATMRDAAGALIDFRVVSANEGACRLMRKAESDLLWRHLSDLELGIPWRDILHRLRATLETGRHDQFETTIKADDCEVHLKIEIASIGDLLSVTLTDIGGVKEREASFRLLFDGNPVPMWLYDPDSLKFVSVNDAAVRHYGYRREQFLAMTLLDIWPRDEWGIHQEVARSVDGAYQSNRSWRHVKADGSEIEVITYARSLTFAERAAILVAVVDVTERKQAEARIAYLAHHDALTGLANRVLFHQRMDEALVRVRRQGEQLAIHCLDLDHFKSVNDTLGHPVGDALLNVVAERLRGCLAEGDFVARLGGDEFAVIQSGIGGPGAASLLAGKLIDVVSQTYRIQGHDVVVGASIGIAIAPGDGEITDALLRNADMALYRAKADGRNAFHFFEPEMDRRLQARRTLELDLRKAYANGEFELFYQPLVNLERDEVSGFEALLRWHHPERGMISPGEFIPLAEEIGLIIPLGEWVLRQACADAATWPGDVKVAVNLSPVQFRSRNLVQAVLTALAYSRLSPGRLELEITESVLLGETEANLTTLHRLREIGARISMDDFGTGYSSLSYLRSFPFDKIKIDRSFVRELVERPDCVAIIRAVTGLGASLGIATTAEGVETREQLEQLRAEGCTEIQGYLISPPRPAGEVPRLLAANHKRMVAAA